MMFAVWLHQQILKKTVLRIPKRHPRSGMPGDAVGDIEKLFVSLYGSVLVIGIFCRQFQRHDCHIQGEHGHPAGSIRLF